MTGPCEEEWRDDTLGNTTIQQMSNCKDKQARPEPGYDVVGAAPIAAASTAFIEEDR
jgi:hypothetical protein